MLIKHILIRHKFTTDVLISARIHKDRLVNFFTKQIFNNDIDLLYRMFCFGSKYFTIDDFSRTNILIMKTDKNCVARIHFFRL